MSELTRAPEQIVRFHATLIHRTVQACQHPELRPQLEPALDQSLENGWAQLVGALRQILDGSRDPALLDGLDDEDHAIVAAVLDGLRDPATLPEAESQGEPNVAAAGLAGLVHAAAEGDAQARQMLSAMVTQMGGAGGALAQLAGVLPALIDGRRDPDALFAGQPVDADTRELVLAMLDELTRLDHH